MIYFSLPYFYENYNFNLFLSKYIEQNPEHINFKCKIDSLYGNFPFSFWHGDTNNCVGQKTPIFIDEMNVFNINTSFPLYFDFSNQFIMPYDFFNSHMVAVLRTFEGSGHYIKYIHKEVYEYIKNNYIGYKFILSENAFLFNKDELDLLDNIDFIELPAVMNNEKEYLKMLQNKNKYYITLGDGCSECSFDTNQICKKQEQSRQATFSSKSIYKECSEGFCYDKLLKDFEELSALGFSKFKIKMPLYSDIKSFRNFMIKFFIKPEFQFDFYIQMEEVL